MSLNETHGFYSYTINRPRFVLFSQDMKSSKILGRFNFWSQGKRHMRKYNGISKEHFHLFLKECEWRFNYIDPKRQLHHLRQWVK